MSLEYTHTQKPLETKTKSFSFDFCHDFHIKTEIYSFNDFEERFVLIEAFISSKLKDKQIKVNNK